MCMFGGSKAKDPVMPPEYAAQRTPTNSQADMAGQREADRLRAKTKTILTGNQGVGAADTSGRKMVLGQ